LGRKFKSDTQIHGLKLICGQSRWKIREASDGDRGEATTNGATVTSSTFKRSTVGSLKSDLGSFKRGGSGIKRPECGNEQARAQPDRAILARHGATVIQTTCISTIGLFDVAQVRVLPLVLGSSFASI
jgi:hypothetical protein